MQRILPATVLALLLFVGVASAHTLYMTVNDNEDGTVTIEGMYSTGSMAADTEVRLEDASGAVIFNGRTDEFGELTFDKPDRAYTIVLDGGPQHVATEDGPQ